MSEQGPQGLPPEDATPAEQSAWKVQAIVDAAAVALAGDAVYAAVVPQGEVRICRIDGHTTEEASWVEVWLASRSGGTGDPQYRIYNPPILVADPIGPVVIEGQTYREDPMCAVAHVVGSLGGATRPRRGSGQ